MKRYLLFIFLFPFVLLSYCYSFAGTVIIRLAENPTVVGPQVSLGDVADIIGPGYGNLERLRRLTVGKAAPAGNSIKLTRDYIKVVLRREGIALVDFKFEGPQTIEALTKSQYLTPSDILPEAKRFILNQLKEAPENVEVKILGTDKKMLIPAGVVRATFRPAFAGKYEGVVLLTAELEINGHRFKTVPYRVNVEISKAVVEAAKPIEKGEKFTTENTFLAKASVSKIPFGALREMGNVLGRTASMPLASGAIVKIDSIYDPPVIARDRIVQAVLRKGNVELTVDARAIEEGKAGDLIRVENTVSHKVLRARILDEKTVLVEQERH
jgi:flagella basal body P-ring formation protein FlgA